MKWRGTGIVLSESRAPQNTRTLSSQQATQRSGWVASKVGLPAIGSKLLNEHGIEWVVRGHAPAPTYETLHRWRAGRVELQMDMYPLIEPQNLSPRLSEFMHAINRCTTKHFGIFDTMPGRRKDGHVPGANSIDTLCNPEANLLFLDAARIHETIIAHEFGHAWVQYVDDCEDFRVLEDTSNPQRMRQVSLVQSFVLDLKVNDLLRRKGFDMSPIEEDQAHTLANLGQMLARGRRFEMAREEAFYAMQVADAMVRRELADATSYLVRLDSSLELIRHSGSPLAALAESFAASVSKHGYDSRDGVLSAIDECLLASFDFCGDSIDLDSELIAINPPEPNTDNFPDWIPALPPKVKCRVGRHMARNDISSEWGLAVNPTITGKARVTFHSPEGDTWSELRLFHPLGPPTRYSHLPDCVAEALAMKIRNQTGSYQLHGGPPHGNPLNPSDPPTSPAQSQPGLFPGNTLGHAETSQEASVQQAFGGTPHRSPLGVAAPATPVESRQPGWSSKHNLGGAGIWPGFGPIAGRPYMAGLGRWTTQARLQEQLAGEHAYAYAMCNPVSYVDPTGNLPQRGRPSPSEKNCYVKVCSHHGFGDIEVTHQYVCAQTYMGNQCAGGLDSTSGYGIGSHRGVVTAGPSETCGDHDIRMSNGIVDKIRCSTVTTDCSVAVATCMCLKQLAKNPPNYVIPTHVCWNFKTDVEQCIEGVLGGVFMEDLTFGNMGKHIIPGQW